MLNKLLDWLADIWLEDISESNPALFAEVWDVCNAVQQELGQEEAMGELRYQLLQHHAPNLCKYLETK